MSNGTLFVVCYHSLIVYQVCHMMSVAVSKVGVVLCRARSEKSMDSIGSIGTQRIRGVLVHDNALYKSTFYLLTSIGGYRTISTNVSRYQTRCRQQYYLLFSNTAHARTSA